MSLSRLRRNDRIEWIQGSGEIYHAPVNIQRRPDIFNYKSSYVSRDGEYAESKLPYDKEKRKLIHALIFQCYSNLSGYGENAKTFKRDLIFHNKPGMNIGWGYKSEDVVSDINQKGSSNPKTNISYTYYYNTKKVLVYLHQTLSLAFDYCHCLGYCIWWSLKNPIDWFMLP